MSDTKYRVKIKSLRNMTMAIYDNNGNEVRELVPDEPISALFDEFGFEGGLDILRSHLEIMKILQGEDA